MNLDCFHERRTWKIGKMREYVTFNEIKNLMEKIQNISPGIFGPLFQICRTRAIESERDTFPWRLPTKKDTHRDKHFYFINIGNSNLYVLKVGYCY